MTPLKQTEAHLAALPVHQLNPEEAIAYILHRLVEADTYVSDLMAEINQNPGLEISDTMLYKALKALLDAEIITDFQGSRGGRGRPRRMFQLQPHYKPQAAAISVQWVQWLQDWEIFVEHRRLGALLQAPIQREPQP